VPYSILPRYAGTLKLLARLRRYNRALFQDSYDARQGSSNVLGKVVAADGGASLPSISDIFYLRYICRPIRGMHSLFPLSDLEKKLLVADYGRLD